MSSLKFLKEPRIIHTKGRLTAEIARFEQRNRERGHGSPETDRTLEVMREKLAAIQNRIKIT